MKRLILSLASIIVLTLPLFVQASEIKAVTVTADSRAEVTETSRVIDGINVSYAVSSLSASSQIKISDIDATYTYRITYSDGSFTERIPSSDHVTDFSVSSLMVIAGNNIYTVTENETNYHYTGTFSVTGIYLPPAPVTPTLLRTEKSGIIMAAYPEKMMISEKLSARDVKAYWIYSDIYSDGTRIEKASSDVVLNLSLSADTLKRGNNTITVTASEVGKNFSTSFIVFGNCLDSHIRDGLYATYAYASAYTTSVIEPKYIKVFYTYTDQYADGTVKAKVIYKDGPSTYTLSTTKIQLGENIYTVKASGLSTTFSVAGIYMEETAKPMQEPTTAPKQATVPKVTAPTPTPVSISVPKPAATITSTILGEERDPDSIPLYKEKSVIIQDDHLLTVNLDWEKVKKRVIITKNDLDDAEFTGYFVLTNPVEYVSQILTEEELISFSQGSDISTEIDVSDKRNIPTADKIAIKAFSPDDTYTVGQPFIIKATKSIDKENTSIKELDGPVSLTLDVPADIRGIHRRYYILRVDDGAVKVLNDLDTEEATVTFDTDRFGTFCFMYEEPSPASSYEDITEPDKPAIYEKPVEPSEPIVQEEPSTFHVPWWIWLILLIILLIITGIITYRKYKEYH